MQKIEWILCSDEVPQKTIMVIVDCNGEHEFGMIISNQWHVFTSAPRENNQSHWVPSNKIYRWHPLAEM